MEKTLPTLKIVVLDDDPNSTELIKVYINHIERILKYLPFVIPLKQRNIFLPINLISFLLGM